MSVARKVFRYQLQNIRRSRIVAGYGLLLLAVSQAMLQFGGGGPRALLSLMNLVLVIVPLVSLVFGTTYLYSAREFIELLLAQPVGRRPLFTGIWGGLTLPLMLAFSAGVGLPFLWTPGSWGELLRPLGALLLVGNLLTATFTALAMWVTVRFDDRARGLGAALAAWGFVALAYDALILLVVVALGHGRLELPILALSLANPVDAGRVGLVLALEAPGLMGYSGAMMVRVLGSSGGAALSFAALLCWSVAPFLIALRRFSHKDF